LTSKKNEAAQERKMKGGGKGRGEYRKEGSKKEDKK
jgi:hypothetical protein